MRRRFLALMIAIAGLAPVSASAADLVLAVKGVANGKGLVMIAVYGNAETFRKDGREIAAIRLKSRKGGVKVTLNDLPKGTYAVAVYHDENGDQKLETNMLGIPSEGYGFSNDARGVMGPPSFDDAAVELRNGAVAVTIELQY